MKQHEIFIDWKLQNDKACIGYKKRKRSFVKAEYPILADLLPKGMWQILILKFVILGLQPALDEVIRIVHYDHEDLSCEGGNQEYRSGFDIAVEVIVETQFDLLVEVEVDEAAGD